MRVSQGDLRESGRCNQVRLSRFVSALALVIGVLPADVHGTARVPETMPDALIVKYRAGTAARSRIHTNARGTRMHSFRLLPADVIKIAPGRTRDEVAAEYAADPDVEYVQPNFIYRVDAVPDDAKFNLQWSLQNTGQSGGLPGADIDAPAAWDRETGKHEIVVAVIDTGIDYTHPDLQPNMWTNDLELNGIALVDDDGNGIVDDFYGARFLAGFGEPTSGNPLDDHFHGTHVAGIIGASGNNRIGIAGVNHSVRLMAVKFIHRSGFGYTADAISGIEYAILMGAHLSNNSWGGDGFDLALNDAIEAAGEAGQLFVAAAGNSSNDNDRFPFYPATYPGANVISVASTDRNDERSYFSSYGVTTVDIAAPGSEILSAKLGGGYFKLSGTSMAAPLVAGVAALLFAHVPGATPAEIKQFILDGADHLPALDGLVAGGRRLNANGALAVAVPSTGSVSFERSAFACDAVVAIRLRDIDLANTGTVNVTVSSSSGDVEIAHLNETATPSLFTGTIQMRSDGVVASDGQLAALDGQTITATYQDADDGSGTFATDVATATVDCIPPQVSNVLVSAVSASTATIEFDTNEFAVGRVRFGTSCSGLGLVGRDFGATAHTVVLRGLTPETTYFFVVDAIDPAETVATDDNGGAWHQLTTLFQPNYLTDLLVSPVTAPIDITGQTTTFTPDGSRDFYSACRERATAFLVDPTGGTPQPPPTGRNGPLPTLEVEVQNGQHVWLYGQAYESFHISKNGTVTFTAPSVEDNSFYIADHFELARVSVIGRHTEQGGRGWFTTKQLADRVVVTFQNLRAYSDPQEGNAQLELFFDGRIRITNLSFGYETPAIVGLSTGGGLPADFVSANLSAAATCGETDPPTVPLAGRKLQYKFAVREDYSHKLRLDIDDPAFELPASGTAVDPTINGASLVLFNPTTAERDMYYLPPVYWRPRGSGYIYEFIDGHGISPIMGLNLPGPCERVEISEDRVKVRCEGNREQGMYFDLDESGGQGSLAVMLTLGAGQTIERYCALFGGTIRKDTVYQGSRPGQFKAKNAPAPAQCPPLL